MVEVIASKISIRKIYYECPFCFTNKSGKHFKSQFFKNGKLAAGRFPTIHHHGNETQKLDNFETSRCSHCSENRESVLIKITDQTERI